MPRPPKGYTPKKCARIKSDGTQCNKWAMHGSDYCKTHSVGKKTQFKPGVMNPNFKHGRYSAHLPVRMLETYEQALSDPELLDLRNAIALVEGRIADILKRVDSGEAGAIWNMLKAAKAEYRSAPEAQKRKPLNRMLDLIDEGNADFFAWDNLQSLLEQRRRLTESEAKRLQMMNQFITVERMQMFILRLQLILKEHIKDQSVLNAIATEIQKLQSVEGG